MASTKTASARNNYKEARRKASRSVVLAQEKTRSSADADNGLYAFSSQSRSTNMVPFSVHCDFSLSM